MINKMMTIIKEKYSIAHICNVNSKDFRFYEYNYQILKGEWLWAMYNEKTKMIEIFAHDGTIIDELDTFSRSIGGV